MFLNCSRFIRTDTVYDQIQEIHKRVGGGPNFHRNVEKALLGAIVITRYNNQTYRVDEIDWEKTPSDEFDGRNGQKMSYQKIARWGTGPGTRGSVSPSW